MLLRDDFTCQYCGRKLSKDKLNLDHVMPRSRGGKSTWENVVASCHPCNRRKGWSLTDAAGMRLMKKPIKPNPIVFFSKSKGGVKYREWTPFLNVIDFSYWNVELEE